MTANTIIIRKYQEADLPRLTELWNEIVEGGISCPQDSPLSPEEATEFFAVQTVTACAHIANASYGVTANCRSKGVGRLLVQNCLDEAKANGFLGLQFNAVVSTNFGAIALYSSLGMSILGTVKNGFHMPSGEYVDTYIFFKAL